MTNSLIYKQKLGAERKWDTLYYFTVNMEIMYLITSHRKYREFFLCQYRTHNETEVGRNADGHASKTNDG